MPVLHGGSAGDLYVIIRTGEHPIFRRDGDDIYLTVPVSATEAALGAKIEVPTIDGRALLKIPPGTQSGQKLRLREKGVPSATKEGVRGDEIVEITVTVPMPRDERTKELLRELAKLNPEDPRAEIVDRRSKSDFLCFPCESDRGPSVVKAFSHYLRTTPPAYKILQNNSKKYCICGNFP